MITTGSVQAPEQLYWGTGGDARQARLRRAHLRRPGPGPLRHLRRGRRPARRRPLPGGPPVLRRHRGRARLRALDRRRPLRPAAELHHRHRPLARSRTAASPPGSNAAFNPLAELVDPTRVGIAGHSLGAAAVSYVGQIDDRVDAIVAWDNLRAPGRQDPAGPAAADLRLGLLAAPDRPAITKPALGISNDYGITPTPNTADPDPQDRQRRLPRLQGRRRRLDGVPHPRRHPRGVGVHPRDDRTGVLGLATPARHATWSPGTRPPGSTSYVKCARRRRCEADADRRLLTDRWRDDARGGQVDANGDPNLYSFYSRSRFDLRDAGGSEVTCDDMRAGCASMAPDGLPAGYDFVADAYTAAGRRLERRRRRGRARCPSSGPTAKDTPATLPPERRRRRDPRRAAATTGCAAATATTASTATPATTASRRRGPRQAQGRRGRRPARRAAPAKRQARRRLRRRPDRRPRRRARPGQLRPRPRQGPRRQARQARRRLLAPAAGSVRSRLALVRGAGFGARLGGLVGRACRRRSSCLAPTPTGSLSLGWSFFVARLRGLTSFSDSGRSSSSPASSRSTSTVVPEAIVPGPWRSTSSASGSSM